MATEPILAALDVCVVQRRRFAVPTVLSDYWALTKPEINFLISITTAAAFCLGSSSALSHFPWILLLNTVVGTVLVASGAATLNQWMEVRFDALMRRTARRPLASERIGPSRALWFGISLSLSGVVYLALSTTILPTLLAALTLLSYLFLYTPLKRITPLCTLIGAVPGAAPPLIGWAAARGRLDTEAWVLFAIVFFWQFPHFMAIAWMYREDYTRAGYLVLPLGEKRSRFVFWQTLLPSVALLAVGTALTIAGPAGLLHSAATLILGAIFLCHSVRFAFRRSNAAARQLLAASVIYLPVVFALLMLK